MHRHGYQGRKFGRETDQRRALIKSLADSLVLRESIQTTLPKAKELSSYVEKLITKAKVGDLHARRQIISALATKAAAHKLVDEIAPKLTGRNSGYLRVERTELRRGDNAQMARISFVDDLKLTKETAVETEEKTEEPKAAEQPKKPATRRRTAKKAGPSPKVQGRG
jgi:large subunit ribosomal protein L17